MDLAHKLVEEAVCMPAGRASKVPAVALPPRCRVDSFVDDDVVAGALLCDVASHAGVTSRTVFPLGIRTEAQMSVYPSQC